MSGTPKATSPEMRDVTHVSSCSNRWPNIVREAMQRRSKKKEWKKKMEEIQSIELQNRYCGEGRIWEKSAKKGRVDEQKEEECWIDDDDDEEFGLQGEQKRRGGWSATFLACFLACLLPSFYQHQQHHHHRHLLQVREPYKCVSATHVRWRMDQWRESSDAAATTAAAASSPSYPSPSTSPLGYGRCCHEFWTTRFQRQIKRESKRVGSKW